MRKIYRIFVDGAGFFELELEGTGLLLKPKLIPNIPEVTVQDMNTGKQFKGGF